MKDNPAKGTLIQHYTNVIRQRIAEYLNLSNKCVISIRNYKTYQCGFTCCTGGRQSVTKNNLTHIIFVKFDTHHKLTGDIYIITPMELMYAVNPVNAEERNKMIIDKEADQDLAGTIFKVDLNKIEQYKHNISEFNIVF